MLQYLRKLLERNCLEHMPWRRWALSERPGPAASPLVSDATTTEAIGYIRMTVNPLYIDCSVQLSPQKVRSTHQPGNVRARAASPDQRAAYTLVVNKEQHVLALYV